MQARADHDRDILRLAVPALATLVIEPLYLLVDTAIVGRLGTDPLAGLAVAGVVLTAMFSLCNFLAYGTTAAVARRAGAGDEPGASQQGMNALWLAAGIGVGLAVLGLALAAPILEAMGASADVEPYALTYLRISLLGAPAVLLGLAGIGYLYGRQRARQVLVVALGANVANVLLELLFVYGFDLGIAGSAWGTVIAQTCAATAYVIVVSRAAIRSGAERTPHLPGIRDTARVSSPLIVRTGSLLAAFLVATSVAARIGDAEVAAHQVAFQVFLFLALALDAIAVAASTLIGHRLGAIDAAGARAIARRSLTLGVAAGSTLALLIVALSPLLTRAFTGDDVVRALLADVLWVVALSLPLNAVVFVLDGVLIGAGESRYLAVAMLGAFALFLPVALLVLATGMGLLALWFALVWFMLARAVGMGMRYRSEAWLVTGASR